MALIAKTEKGRQNCVMTLVCEYSCFVTSSCRGVPGSFSKFTKMGWFKAPETRYENYFDESKFRMTWNVMRFMVLIFAFLTISQYFNGAPDAFITLIAFVYGVSMLILMRVRQDYRLVAMVSGIAGFVINQLNIFTVMNGERFIDLLWILVVALYLFYALGIRWGVVSLLTNFAGLVLYLLITPVEKIIEGMMDRNATTELDIFINAGVTICVITYLLIKISQATKHAEQNYIKANVALREQNGIVVAQNKEKTVLLKEIHHRVKNNLQVISSLLKLQARESGNTETEEQLFEAVNRISSMALIHEKRYRTSDLARIDLAEYLNSLIEEIVASQANALEISVNVQSDIDHVSINHLVPLALIFNELATNTLKHGLSVRKTGKIEVSIQSPNEQTTTMAYADDGTWKTSEKGGGFGTMLIETFVEQLDGACELSHENGTRYQFTFKNLRYDTSYD
jgi:two-component sensor histidine kinase